VLDVGEQTETGLTAEESRATSAAAARLDARLASLGAKRVAWRAYACAALADGDVSLSAAVEAADKMLGYEEQRFGPL